MEDKILNIIKEAKDGITFKEIMGNFEPYEEFEVQICMDVLRDDKKVIKLDKESRKFYHSSQAEEDKTRVHNDFVSGDDEIIVKEEKKVIINGKLCYLSKNNNDINLNWYNPNARAYEQVLINKKDDSLEWLHKFNGPVTTKEYDKCKKDNDLLWDSINISYDEINKINDRLKYETVNNNIEVFLRENKKNDTKKYILQKDNKILYEVRRNDGKTLSEERIFNGYFLKINKNYELLDLEEPYYELFYIDNGNNGHKSLKGSAKDIADQLTKIFKYYDNEKDIRKLISTYIDELEDNDDGFYNNYYKLDGYLINQEKEFVLNNSNHQEFKELSEEDLKTEVQETIELLNKYLGDLHNNFTPIFKQFLLTAYYYLFRQLNIQAPIKFMYLYGKGLVGKTTTSNSFNSLYMLDPKETPISTPASIKRTVQNNYNTYLIVADEFDRLTNKNNIDDTMHQLKTSRFSLRVGTVSDLQDQNKIKSYHNFSYLLGTTNKDTDFGEGMSRVLLAYKFNSSLSDSEKQYLEDKYIDINLISLGYVFSLEMQKLYNTIGKNGFKKAFGSETRTNDTINRLLKNIENKYDVEFCKELLEVNPYKTNYNDENVFNAPRNAWSKLVNSCNAWIKKNNRNKYLTPYDYLQTKLTTFKSIKIHNKEYVTFTLKEFEKFINTYADEVIHPKEFLNEIFIDPETHYNDTEYPIYYLESEEKDDIDNGKSKVMFGKVKVFYNDNTLKNRIYFNFDGSERKLKKFVILNKKGVYKMFLNIDNEAKMEEYDNEEY